MAVEREELQRILRSVRPVGGAGPDDSLILSGPLHRRPYSLVFRAEATNTTGPLAVKVCLDPGTGGANPGFARRQFKALTRVAEAMSGEQRYRSPRPLWLIEEHGVVAQEWIPGRSLLELLLDRNCSGDELLEAAGEAGRWLRRFHENHPLPEGAVQVEERMAGLTDQVRRAPGLGADPVVSAALRALERMAPRVAESPLPRSWVHGDYQPSNLLISNDRVDGIDMKVEREDVYLVDVVNLLNDLDNFFGLPKGRRVRSRGPAIADAFRHGYSARRMEIDRAPTLWLRIFTAIRFWARFHKRGKTPFHDWFLSRSRRTLIRTMTAESLQEFS